ncbi:hypothetical protein TNCV_3455831 [Trichonephila clavipes]|nr:hypothetical protein TNCV_3455831 [Trichonephila clavipes]
MTTPPQTCQRSSLVVKVIDSWSSCRELSLVALKTRRAGERCILNLSMVKRPVLVWLGMVSESDSRPEALGSMSDTAKYPPITHGVRARLISGSEVLWAQSRAQ